MSTAHFLHVYTTNLALTSFFTGWAALLAVAAVIRWTRLGRMIRAVWVNQRLSLAMGINPQAVYLVAVMPRGPRSWASDRTRACTPPLEADLITRCFADEDGQRGLRSFVDEGPRRATFFGR